ncbi:MAG: ATP-binding cassette domain-containing protein [Streptococcaceae bacterium]|jgi:ABC-2 type transport system ATP-binding protein|nr:ATP-binding cassette domain-containing protein [Streptococcaceae bacterium]
MTEIQVKNLTTDLFKNLSFELFQNGLYGFVGRNGIGKSTLFSILNKEIKISIGEIKVGKVCYIPSLEIFDKNITANDYFKLLSDEEKITLNKNLELMGNPDFFNKKIGTYSLGMKELFAFIFAISIESDILILDELIDGLDEKNVSIQPLRFGLSSKRKPSVKTKQVIR